MANDTNSVTPQARLDNLVSQQSSKCILGISKMFFTNITNVLLNVDYLVITDMLQKFAVLHRTNFSNLVAESVHTFVIVDI